METIGFVANSLDIAKNMIEKYANHNGLNIITYNRMKQEFAIENSSVVLRAFSTSFAENFRGLKFKKLYVYSDVPIGFYFNVVRYLHVDLEDIILTE